MGKSKKSAFDPDNYCLIYEEAMACGELRALFLLHLKNAMAEEPLLYLEELDKYKVEYAKIKLNTSSLNSSLLKRMSSIGNASDFEETNKSLSSGKNQLTNLFVGLKGIIEEFIEQGATKELNLSSVRHWTLDRWQEVEALMNQAEQDSSNTDLLDELYLKLNADILLERVDMVVQLDLKMDQFPRFIRSEMVRKFLLEKGEHFTRTVAIDISKGYKVDLRFKPKDLKDKEIHDNHIYFGLTIAEDTPDWELILDKSDTYQTYLSKTPYVFNQDTMIGMQLAKAMITLPYNIEDVWKCCWNTQTVEKFDPMVFKGRKAHKYLPPPTQDTTKGTGYAQSLLVSNINFFPIAMRTLYLSTTMVRDSDIDAILMVGHSAENLQQDFPDEKIDYKLIQGFFYWTLFKVNENVTRVMISTYSEINIPIFSSFIYRKMAIKRTKMIRKSMMEQLGKWTDSGRKNIDSSSFIDELDFKKSLEGNALKFPNRSWYKEWLNLKQNSNQ